MATFILVLRVIHIFASVYWVGAGIAVTAFIIPSAKAVGPEGGKFFRYLVGPGHFRISMYVSALAGVLSGTILYGMIHGFRLGVFHSPFGLSITVGAVTGLMALAHGVVVKGRLTGQVARLAEESRRTGQPLTAEQLARIQALEAKVNIGGALEIGLLAISTIAMAAARYL